MEHQGVVWEVGDVAAELLRGSSSPLPGGGGHVVRRGVGQGGTALTVPAGEIQDS